MDLGITRTRLPAGRVQRDKRSRPYAIYGLAWLNTPSQIRDETDVTSAFSQPIIFELL